MPIKSLKKLNLNKKTEGILLLGITNWYWGQKLFCHLIWSSDMDSTFHLFTVGAQRISRVFQNLVSCRRNCSAYRRRRKLRFFLFERTWALEWFKILIKLKILILFVHSKSQSRMESPPKMKQFLILFFVLLILLLFMNENILNFNHRYLCQRPLRFD